MPKKCNMHHYIIESTGKHPLGVCKHCGKEKVHSNVNEPPTAKRITNKGRAPQKVVGIVLSAGKERSPHFNPSSTEHNLNKSRPHFANGFKGK